MNVQLDYDYLYQTVILGDENTGKSCYLRRFVEVGGAPSFDAYRPTIGVEFATRIIRLNDVGYKLLSWDTAGQSQFRTIITSYLKGARGVIVAYSVTNRRSFENLDYWLKLIEDHNHYSALTILVGTKCDLEEQREVSYKTAKDFADERKLLLFEVSSKDNYNVEQSFLTLLAAISLSEESAVHTESTLELNDTSKVSHSCKLL